MRSLPCTIKCSVSSTRSMRLIITSVPTSYISSDLASPSEDLSGRTLKQASSFSSLVSAASTAAIDPGRPTDSGTIVSGNKVVFCNGSTGMTKGTPSGFFAIGCDDDLFALVSVCAMNFEMSAIDAGNSNASPLGPVSVLRASAKSRAHRDNHDRLKHVQWNGETESSFRSGCT